MNEKGPDCDYDQWNISHLLSSIDIGIKDAPILISGGFMGLFFCVDQYL